MRIGIDFDNTLVNYDDVLAELAARFGLIPERFSGTKREIRDRIRSAPEGELAWMHLQAQAYGSEIGRARPSSGAKEFVAEALRRGVSIAIVSHKTEFAAAHPGGTNLRSAALAWLRANEFLGPGALSEDSVYFESSRSDKGARIARLGCTHFIDDLEEFFDDPAFPSGVIPLFFSALPANGSYESFASFGEIQRRLFP